MRPSGNYRRVNSGKAAMNKKLVIVIGVAVLAATGSTYFFYPMISKNFVESGNAAARDLSVIVAARDLQRGEALSLGDIEEAPWSGRNLPPGALTDTRAVVGKALVVGAVKGETLLAEHIHSEADAFAAVRIRRGMRAVSVHLTEFAGVNEIVEAGDRVDVLVATGRPGAGNNEINMKTILQNVEVLSTGRVKEGKGTPVATLLVAAEHSEMLNTADHAGYIRLALRNPLDDKVEPTPGTRLRDVLRAKVTSSEVAPPAPTTPQGVDADDSVEVPSAQATPAASADANLASLSTK